MKSAVVLLLILTLFACKSEKQPKKNAKIDRIVLATGGCNGRCSYQALDITKNLKMNFFGGKYSELEGDYHSSIKQVTWDTICEKLNQMEIMECDSVYNRSLDDQSIELILYSGKKMKRIRGQEFSFPDELRIHFYGIIDLTKTMHLKKSKQAHQFPTTYQKVNEVIIEFIPPMPELD